MSTSYFSHDSNASTDLKIINMRLDYGFEGYGIYWAIIEQMRVSDNYKIELKNINALSMLFHLTPEKLSTFIDDCLNKYDLFDGDDSHFWSVSFLERMSQMDSIIKTKTEKARKAATSRWDRGDRTKNNQENKTPENAQVMPMQCNGISDIETEKCTSNAQAMQVHNTSNASAMPNKSKLNKTKEKHRTHSLTLSHFPESETKTADAGVVCVPNPPQINNSFPDRYEKIMDVWNVFANDLGLPGIRAMPEERKKLIEKISKQPNFELNEIFSQIKNSDFLLGRSKNSNWPGCSFDWILSKNKKTGVYNWLEIVEGKYKNKKDHAMSDMAEFLERHKDE